MDAAGSLYVTTRCQTENVRYTTGKLTKIWYGDTEPVVSIASESSPNRVLPNRIKLSLSSKGRLQIELKNLDNQSVKYFDLEGKALINQVTSELP